MKKKVIALFMCAAMIGTMLIGCSNTNKDGGQTESKTGNGEKNEVTLTVGYASDVVMDGFEAVSKEAEKKYGLKIELQPYSNTDDTAFRSLLASGEAPDMILYNSGSLLKRINPSQYFKDLSSSELMKKLDDDFKNSVTVDDVAYGIPVSSSMAGGIFYNKEMYKKYNLEVPKTWNDFLKNCQAIKDGGETAVIGSFGSSWTSQLVFLADYFNVTAAEPNFSKEFEEGKAKYADTPITVKTFEKYGDLIPYYNEDCAVATYDDACTMLSEGTGAHYFMQSQVLSNIYSLYDKEAVDNIGFFSVPGESVDSNGMTMWPSNAIYVNKDSEKTDDVLRFLEYYLSEEALNIYGKKMPPTGPFHVVGYEPKGDLFAAVAEDMQGYFDAGNVALAQEYETAVKGSNCESICVEVANGQISGKEAAEKYDDDCYKQAIQLGLNWDK